MVGHSKSSSKLKKLHTIIGHRFLKQFLRFQLSPFEFYLWIKKITKHFLWHISEHLVQQFPFRFFSCPKPVKAIIKHLQLFIILFLTWKSFSNKFVGRIAMFLKKEILEHRQRGKLYFENIAFTKYIVRWLEATSFGNSNSSIHKWV